MKPKIIECPRDAMQGIAAQIPTQAKIDYLNALMGVGFDVIDFGSFVSPKAVPQMADTLEVLDNLDLGAGSSKLLAIVVNEKGAQTVGEFAEVTYLGYPLSISETFQQRNTRMSVAQGLDTMRRIQALCEKNDQQLVVYLSMGFGNPYGDAWSPELVAEYVQKVAQEGVEIISLADTVGTAFPHQVSGLYSTLIPEFDWIEFGAHFHATPEDWELKIDAAYQAGCRRFDGALKGYGGCPFAEDTLTGNIATEQIINYLEGRGERLTGLKKRPLGQALQLATELFGTYH
ncbi:MAG: hydroxymethylglutaryl-CoA lyase [Bacteroidetes bacterium]|jgi:hydroxymethylglutaryl-CoA lyase|nr:hydroxymethylglutaryl-CoA lyase [Bacteroidota bacterium]